MKAFLPLAIALAGCSLFVTGCVEETDVVYTERPALYGTADVDFYYVGEAPYSRQYGMLYYRDNGYYYRRGSNYVFYNRPVYDRRDFYTRRRAPLNSRESRGLWDERYVRWDRERARMDRDRDFQRVSNERRRDDVQRVSNERRRDEQRSRARGQQNRGQRDREEEQRTLIRGRTASN